MQKMKGLQTLDVDRISVKSRVIAQLKIPQCRLAVIPTRQNEKICRKAEAAPEAG